MGPDNKVTSMLYIFMSSGFSFVAGNSHDAPKLIESLHPKNNNYLLMDRAYEDDKTLALAKNHGFKTVVPTKKNRKLP